MTISSTENSIAILQYNVAKNLSRTHSLLNDPSSSKYNMLIVQEQYWSKYTESAPVHRSWTLIEGKHFSNR